MSTAKSKPPANLLFVRLDRHRGLALLKGPMAKVATTYVGREDMPPRWSRSAGGWVVSYESAGDVIAYGEMRGWIVRVSAVARQDGAA